MTQVVDLYRVVLGCYTLSPYHPGLNCSLPCGHVGTHYNLMADCVWDDEGRHLHDGEFVDG